MTLLIGMVGARQIPESVLLGRNPATSAEGHLHGPFDPVLASDIEMNPGEGNTGGWFDVGAFHGIFPSVTANSPFAAPCFKPQDHASWHGPIISDVRGEN
jgi:hypothetical protein